MAEEDSGDSFLDKIAPPSVKQFDAFPKLPSTYQHRSESRGFITVLVGLMCFVLVLNDLAEFIWGWPEYRFDIDREVGSYMRVNLDMVVNMPCRFLSVDLRDATGDRLFLSDAFKRDGTVFDAAQARALQESSDKKIAEAASVVPQTRRTRGFFSTLLRTRRKDFKPTKYVTKEADDACRIYGNMVIKKVTANLHITTLGHGYASNVHVDHKHMNLTHVISEFSFGPYFPEIVQPLDNVYAMTQEHFTAFQYFLTVVPTRYKYARGRRVRTNQYSVTNYVRHFEHNAGTPGIFFKFDLDPVGFEIEEKTTTFVQFIIRVVGVVGGVWCCMGWAVKISYRAYEAVSGQKEGEVEIVAVEASGAKKRWGGGELKKRVVKQGNGWVVEGSNEWGGGGTTPPYTANTGSYGYPSSPGQGYASTVPLPSSAPISGSYSQGGSGGYYPSPQSPQTNYAPASPYSNPSGLPSSPLPPRQHSTRRGSQGSVGSAGSMNARMNGGAPAMSDEQRAFKDR